MPSFLHRSKKDKKATGSDGQHSGHSPDEDKAQDLHLRPTDDLDEGLWQQAWTAVKKEVDWELPESLQNAEHLSTKEEVDALQREAVDRRNLSESSQRHVFGTKHTYREVCDKVSSCAQKFQFVGDMVTQAEPVYAALPWTAIRFVISCAVGESETYHNILDGTEYISGLVVQYPAIEQIYAKIDSEPSTELRRSLLHLYKLILRFQLYSVKYFDPKHKIARTFAGLNPVKAETIKGQIAAIDKAKQKADSDIGLVDAEVTKVGIDNILVSQADQKEQLQAIQDTLRALSGDSVSIVDEQRAMISEADRKQQARNEAFVEMWKTPLDDLKRKLEDERVQREKENLHNVRKWLSRAEPETDYANAKGKRKMHLGEWLIEHRTFKEWQVGTSSAFLWLYGFAGTGKTSLVCRVLDEIRSKLSNADLTEELGRLAFFYCSSEKSSTGREGASRADPGGALRSIISQLSTSQQGRSVAPIVQEKYEAIGPGSDNRRALNDAECVEIVTEIARQIPITIILDAFDELDQDNSHQLIQNLQGIVRRCPEGVKIFISTRSFPAIEDCLKADPSIEVTPENNGEDVKTFIEKTLEASISEGLLLDGKVSEVLKSDIAKTLTKRAQNMFLYASLLLSQLCDKNNTDDEDSIRKKLEGLPKDITEAYNQIMLQVHDNKKNSERSCRIAQETFKWLLYGQEILGHDAFLEAVSPPEKKVDDSELLRACRTLVVRGDSSYEAAHYSVREHIGRMEDYSASQCHIVATKSCLRILNKMFGFDMVHHDLSPSEKAFGQYALLWWPLHYERISQDDLNEHRSAINAMLRTFLLQGRSKVNKYEQWFTRASEKAKPMKNNELLTAKLSALKASPLTPLFAAAVFGLEDLVSKFGRELDELNKCNEHGQTALCLAIENNKLGVVKALLSSRFPADINLLNVNAVQQFEDWDEHPKPQVKLYASALQCAAANGMLEIAEFLIGQGAHVDLVAGYYGSPLQAAALNGHAPIVELLLRNNAEPNSQGGFFGNALQAAAASGHVDIINLLLEHKPPAIVSAPGGRYGSALMAAICSGSSDTVFALLEEKADPSLRSKAYGRPLEKAADMGYSGKEIVKDLLEFKAEADLAPKGEHIHILHKAAIYDMRELASYCLDKSCDIGMTTVKGPWYPRRFGDFAHEMTPLAYACAEGHLDMVKMLLRRGASLERNKDPAGVLWVAAYQGHADVVDALINTFKDTHDHEATMKFIEQRPSPKSGHPILWAACSAPSPETVRMLLDHGARYESNWYKATPLLATATFGRPRVAETLLDYHRRGKIDICLNQRANNGRTALFEACEMNRQRIVEQLLYIGADYAITDDQDCTPLHAATHHDNIGVLSSLYRHAREQRDDTSLQQLIDARAKSGQTALIHAVERNRLPFVYFLLDVGADYTISGHAGNNPLHWASRGGNEEIVRRLLDHAQQNSDTRSFQIFLDSGNREGRTALFLATAEKKLNIMHLLLGCGADYSIANNHGETALHVAAYGGSKDRLAVLLEASVRDSNPSRFAAFINARNDQGKTALFDSVKPRRGHFSVQATRLLLDYGADLTIPHFDDVTPLHHACFEGRVDLVKMLLDHALQTLSPWQFNAYLNARNDKGFTPLRDAVQASGGHPELEIIQLLLDRGADYTIPNSPGNATPLHFAAYHGHVNTVQMLLTRASKDGPERLKSFLDARNDAGRTALLDAAEKGRPKVTQLLLHYGIDFAIADNMGLTALHWCVPRDQEKTMRVLLQKTLDDTKREVVSKFVNHRTSHPNNRSALDDACIRGNKEISKLLLMYGADYVCDSDGMKTPLHHAIDKGHKDLGLFLIFNSYNALSGPTFDMSRAEQVKRLGRFLCARDENGEDAQEAARRKGMTEIMLMVKRCLDDAPSWAE